MRSSALASCSFVAAGTWHDVFGIEPHKIVEASEGLVTDLKKA